MLDLFAKTGSLCLLKTLTDGLEWCGLLWCFYQLFGLSFWRHPFTAEHSLVSKWWNATFLQICSHEETNWSWPILKCITCDGGNWWTGRSGCSPHVSVLQVPADVEKCQDRVECFNADLKADWDRWENNKRQDFRQLLTGMADKNIQYYEKVRLYPPPGLVKSGF